MGKLDILQGQVSRRSFMKGSLALGAAVSLFGCSKEESELYGYGNNSNLGMTPDLVPGTIEGDVYYGATPHNCGGENCILKAYVQNGAVKRIVTDERPDVDMGGGLTTRKIEHVLDAEAENPLFTIQIVLNIH